MAAAASVVGTRRLLFYGSVSLAAVLVPTATADTSTELIPRNFSGEGNNIDNPTWGATGATLIRAVADADYADTAFTPPGSDRPSAREILTDVFLSSTAAVSSKSSLFVAWGQLLTYDLSLTSDNASEPFDIACDDGGGVVDVWCPLGAESDAILFDRSDAAVSDSVRNPINYATSYIDLDYMYGRTEAEAEALRTLEGGLMNITDSGVPHQNADGTWLIGDQRTARFPVTFALHIMLLLEHNRCCIDVAPANGFEEDEDIFQACRAWTIAIFQHITENDFIIILIGSSVSTLGITVDSTSATDSSSLASDTAAATGLKGSHSHGRERRRRRQRSRRLSEWSSRSAVGGEGSGGESSLSDFGAFLGGERGESDEGGWSSGSVGVSGAWEDGGELHSGDNGEMAPDGSAVGGAAGGESSSLSARAGRWGRVRVAGEGGAGPSGSRRRLAGEGDYNSSVNPGADVFAITAGGAAFESALPPTVRIVSEGYISVSEDNIELTSACEDLGGLFERNDVGNILRGAVLSPSLEVDTYYSGAVSNLSPLFKLPVDAVQRGRDHGLPSYNDARLDYNLSVAADFLDITEDEDLAALISAAYGGDIDNVDAITGVLAEDTSATTGGIFGDLLYEAWIDQLYRSIAGDRFYHLHTRTMENVVDTTLSSVINRTLGVSDLPLSVFSAPGVTVCGSDCEEAGEAEITLSDSFGMSWQITDDDSIIISLRAKGIGDAGMLAVGFGGLVMADAEDYIICEVTSDETGECIDRSYITTRDTPLPDVVNWELEVTEVAIVDGWTTITFVRDFTTLDDEDYDLAQDISDEADTLVIYSFREGAGVGQHPNANRGAATVNFVTGDVETECDDNDFVSLHGALMLIAWLILAPVGIYYIRYRKGETVEWAGNEWYEMHEEIMILAAEAVLPLGITAVFASGGDHTTDHAHWGYYMIAAVALQLLTGWMRTKGLEAKHANFSLLHRCNKYFHIWAGRFAYVAGVVQCYRGLELVVESDELVFSAGDGLDLQLGSFGWISDYAFPTWLAVVPALFIFLEARKQYRRYFKKGAANVCGVVSLINEEYRPGDDASKGADRLVPRTEALEIYSVLEFNDKVLNGQSWVLVDGAILDVSNFSQRHPGGARLILNAVGTDVTHELLGEELSVGHAMSFSPHVHPESAWEIVRSLVVGYIEEEEEEDDEGGEGEEGEGKGGDGGGARERGAVAGKEKESIFGKTPVLLAKARVTIGPDELVAKAKRLNNLATIPVAPGPAEGFGVALRKAEASGDPNAITTLKRTWSSKKLLERFHVCPLLFRERMLPFNGVGTPSGTSKRPVYKYIFSCPGQAQALPQAINGVCYFNMRVQEAGKGVIQRSYNAYAVRVLDSQASTPGGGVRGGGGTGSGTRTITPAGQSSEGVLCIEMRIRLYPDGAMSKLLEKLANATDNPAVQLQGPFVIQKLVPPPAHRNVVMIAAGTGINPMVQQIRDYLAFPRDATQSSKSRLALVWQSTSEAELYGTDEITKMQAKSNGLLEVTVLISGEHRKRNVPGAAFRKAKQRIINNARNLVSPNVSVSRSSSIIAQPGGRAPRGRHASRESIRSGESVGSLPEEGPSLQTNVNSFDGGGRGSRGRTHQRGTGAGLAERGSGDSSKFGPHPMRLPFGLPRESHSPTRKSRLPMGTFLVNSSRSTTESDVGGGLSHGKVTRGVLEKVFGPAVLAALEVYGRPLEASSRGRSGRAAARNQRQDEEDDDALDELAGNDEVGGKLQVVVSGPSGFVFFVENILAEIGVPSSAIVLLD